MGTKVVEEKRRTEKEEGRKVPSST